MEERLLQVDHRIPYEIDGEQDENNIDCYMLLSPLQTEQNRGRVNIVPIGHQKM